MPDIRGSSEKSLPYLRKRGKVGATASAKGEILDMGRDAKSANGGAPCIGTVEYILPTLRSRLFAASQIDLDGYIKLDALKRFVGAGRAKVWDATKSPMGMKFPCPAIDTLERQLVNSPAFAKVRWNADLRSVPRGGTAFRQVSSEKSLHIILDIAGENSPCEIHLDEISIVVGRTNDGYVEYTRSVPTLLKHFASEKLHMEQGWVFTPMDQ